MDAEQIAALIASFQTMAQSNQQLVAAMQANNNAAALGTNGTNGEAGATATAAPGSRPTQPDVVANVALTSIKVPMDMGENAEERLVNFHEWAEEVNDKLKVAGVDDQKLQTRIALMWGGKDVKAYATEKAKVRLDDDTGAEPAEADTWDSAITKITTVMEEGINETFAMFKFRQQEQGQRNIGKWYKQLKSSVKTLRLGRCTCGHGYTEDRAIRDVMVEMTNDGKLRKDGLSKDLSLAEVVRAGEANELARSRAATVEGKSVNRVHHRTETLTDDTPTDEEAKLMVAKLRKTGKYSIKAEKQQQKSVECDRCTNARRPHASSSCYFKDQKCRVCKETGHMGGSKMCKATEVKMIKVVETVDTEETGHHQPNEEALESPHHNANLCTSA